MGRCAGPDRKEIRSGKYKYLCTWGWSQIDQGSAGMAAQIKVCAGSYHKNKYITEVIARFDANEEKMLCTAIQQAHENEDTEYYNKSVQHVLGKRPEREETITDAETYLLNQMAGVSIRKHDPEARNGGASEPHVSHILPGRLSSRPKGWSKETLKHFAPILANGSEVRMICKQQPELTPLQKKAVKKVKKEIQSRNPQRGQTNIPGNRKAEWMVQVIPQPYL